MSMKVKEIIILTASYYGVTLKGDVLLAYAEDLSDFPEDQVVSAYKAYRRNSKNTRFPLPAQIIGMLEGQKDERLDAATLASQLDKLAQAKGANWNEGYFYDQDRRYYHGKEQNYWSFNEALESFVGPIGVSVVEKYGGWKFLVSSSQNTDQGQFVAQLRDFIQGQLIGIKSEQLALGCSKAAPDPQIEFNAQKNEALERLMEGLKKNLSAQAVKELIERIEKEKEGAGCTRS